MNDCIETLAELMIRVLKSDTMDEDDKNRHVAAISRAIYYMSCDS